MTTHSPLFPEHTYSGAGEHSNTTIVKVIEELSVSKKKEKIPPVLHITHVPTGLWKALAENVLLCFEFFDYFKYMQPEDNLLLMELFLTGVMVTISDY